METPHVPGGNDLHFHMASLLDYGPQIQTLIFYVYYLRMVHISVLMTYSHGLQWHMPLTSGIMVYSVFYRHMEGTWQKVSIWYEYTCKIYGRSYGQNNMPLQNLWGGLVA